VAKVVETVGAADEAQSLGMEVIEILPDWDLHGKSAGMIRNAEIVKQADEVVAFWDGSSKGTKNTIDRAEAAGKLSAVILEAPNA